LAENTDNSNRPKPIGHEELSNKWVGAGHLKAGDRLKKADGTLGTVVYVNTLAETRKMYNLEVQSAHTFFVGQNGWLTHNCKLPYGINKSLDDIADRIANGHALGKHGQKDLKRLGISSAEDLKDAILDGIKRAENSPLGDKVRTLSNGRRGFYDPENRTVIIIDPKSKDLWTIMIPDNPWKYFMGLK